MKTSAQQPEDVRYVPIGVIYSEHRRLEETPIQPVYARGCRGRIEVRPDFAPGLRDLEGFSHIIVIYHFHRSTGPELTVRPFTDVKSRGIFSTRHPHRPNPIGFSVVRLAGIEGALLHIEDVDILDGTPLLDIKPFVPRFDLAAEPHGGWTENIDEPTARRRGLRNYRKEGGE